MGILRNNSIDWFLHTKNNFPSESEQSRHWIEQGLEGRGESREVSAGAAAGAAAEATAGAAAGASAGSTKANDNKKVSYF